MKLIQDKAIYEEFLKAQATSRRLLQVTAPGRMNLIGEHTDYNGGKVMPFAINKCVTLTCRRPSSLVAPLAQSQFLFTSEHTQEIFVANLADVISLVQTDAPAQGALFTARLDEALRKSWACYAMGALYHLALHLGNSAIPREPVWIHIQSDLPVGAGISSSAALTTGLLAALYTAFDLPLIRNETAKQAMLIEHHFIGTKCGLMDQLAVLCSEAGSLLMVDFLAFPQHQEFTLRRIKAHPVFNDYQLVGLNTGVKHNLSDSPYNERRAACERMVTLLNHHFASTYASLGEYALAGEGNPLRRVLGGALQQDKVRNYLATSVLRGQVDSDRLARFAAHAICENERVEAAAQALTRGDVVQLDALLEEGHLSLQHDYAVSCEELDAIREYASVIARGFGEKAALLLPAIVGPRMTGGGFGGSTIQMVHTRILDQFIQYFSSPHNAYTQRTRITPKIIVTSLAAGLNVVTGGG